MTPQIKTFLYAILLALSLKTPSPAFHSSIITTINGSANSYDEGKGIATDSGGNIYVMGFVNGFMGVPTSGLLNSHRALSAKSFKKHHWGRKILFGVSPLETNPDLKVSGYVHGVSKGSTGLKSVSYKMGQGKKS